MARELTPNEKRLRNKQRRDLPDLMRRVQAAVRHRWNTRQKICKWAIANDLDLWRNWQQFKWVQPAVALVERWQEKQFAAWERELLDLVEAEIQRREAEGLPINRLQIGLALDLQADWSRPDYAKKAARLVDMSNLPKGITARNLLDRDGFLWQSPRGHYWATRLPEPDVFAMCRFTGDRNPTWRVLRFQGGEWRSYGYACERAIAKLMSIYGQQAA